nr:Retrovirus-related Pol polyprotein from transposon TNT 1-94 [Ipomoea batatas]
MASDNFVQPAIPRFDGHYDHWSMLMENFLRSKELWVMVETAVAEPTADMSADQRTRLEGLKLKDLKAKNYLFQAIDRSILETILSKDSSKNIWDSMKKKFKGNTKAKRLQLQALRSEYETLRMKEGEKASEFVSRVMALVSKLQSNGDQIDEASIVEKILWSMTPKYNFVVCAIEEGNDTSKMTLDELESSLFSHEQKLNLPDREAEQALKASVHDRSSSRGDPHDNNEDNLSTENVDIQHEETDQNIPVHSPTAVEVDDSRPRRAIRRPAWMSDYEVTGLHSEDPLVHLALFSDCDPGASKSVSGGTRRARYVYGLELSGGLDLTHPYPLGPFTHTDRGIYQEAYVYIDNSIAIWEARDWNLQLGDCKRRYISMRGLGHSDLKRWIAAEKQCHTLEHTTRLTLGKSPGKCDKSSKQELRNGKKPQVKEKCQQALLHDFVPKPDAIQELSRIAATFKDPDPLPSSYLLLLTRSNRRRDDVADCGTAELHGFPYSTPFHQYYPTALVVASPRTQRTRNSSKQDATIRLHLAENLRRSHYWASLQPVCGYRMSCEMVTQHCNEEIPVNIWSSFKSINRFSVAARSGPTI